MIVSSSAITLKKKEKLNKFWGDSSPLNACTHKRDPERAYPCVKLRCLSHHSYCFCDVQFSWYAIVRKIYLNQTIVTMASVTVCSPPR
jgi:hypothetical protein